VRRYEQALEVIGPEPSMERARLLSLLPLELYWSGEHDRRMALAREALQVARSVGEHCVDVVIPPYVMATWEPSTRLERLALVDELEARASGTGTIETRFYAHYLRQVCLAEGGDVEAAAAELEVASELADELRYPILRWRCLTRASALMLLAGPDAGEAASMAALEVGQACGQPDALSSFGAQYFLVSWDRGQLAGLEDTVVAFVDAMPGIPAWRAVLALLYIETEQWERAAEQVALTSRPDCKLPVDSAWMVGTCLLGECVARLGDRDRATLLYDYLLPYQNEVIDVVQGLSYLGSVARVLGGLAASLERWSEADRHFVNALAIERRIGAACFAVRTRRDHAAALSSRGPSHRDRAVDLARSALGDAEALGMAADVARLRRLLADLDAGDPLLADRRSRGAEPKPY
jgi:tetratricopeptide (TPR) repeat protein